MGQQASRKDRVIFYSFASLVLALLAFEIAALVLWVPGTWNARLTAVLAIVGIYGLAIGFISGNATLAVFKDELEALTSPDVRRYLMGNFFFLIFPFQLTELSGSKDKAVGYPVTLGCLGMLLLLALSPVLIVYAVFHILIVMPLSYLPVVMASAIVTPIIYSVRDIQISVGNRRISVKSIVEKDPVAAKGFLIGIPAIFISLLSAISAPFISG